MEADGSFFLKNLGKSSVLVNGVAVACGQLMNLSTSCLIEVIYRINFSRLFHPICLATGIYIILDNVAFVDKGDEFCV